jgi:hypothetical protein
MFALTTPRPRVSAKQISKWTDEDPNVDMADTNPRPPKRAGAF